MYFINGKIHTMEGTGYESGYLHVVNGKIAEVGDMSEFTLDDEKMVDLMDRDVYPGFIDAHTHLGMFEDAITFEGDDGNEETEPLTPQLRALDAINPLDRCFTEALQEGVTTVVTGPGSANPIAGQMLAMKTYGRRIDDMILKEPLAIKFALGENPKSVYHSKNQAPTTRMATAAVIREQLWKAKRYLDDKTKVEQDLEGDYEPPEYDARCEALLPLLERKIQAHFHAHRADDIFTAIRIAKEFNLDLVLVHGTEGHLILLELLKDQVPVLSGPFLGDRCKPELKNMTPQSPGLLAKAGISTAIITDHPETPIQYLPLCAALAVREGMDREQALQSITIVPARICGLDRRVGSIREGKDADLVVYDGDPLDLMNRPQMVVVGGNIVYEKK